MFMGMKTPFKASRFLSLALSFSLAASLALVSSCSSSKKDGEDDMSESSIANTVGADENSGMDSDSGKAMGLQTVLFPFDSFAIDDAGKETLRANAAILKTNGSVNIQIEGHCDIQGGTQYNIALGEKRAASAKKFLEEQGIASGRIATISFGKEKPIAAGNSDEAHARNRRGNFVITSK